MKTIRPNVTDPIPLRRAQPKIGTIIVRLLGILLVAVAAVAWRWSR